MSVRFGFDAMRALLEGCKTSSRYSAPNKVLRCSVTRFAYALVYPVTAGERLLVNYDPDDRKVDPTLQISETDSKFFGSSP